MRYSVTHIEAKHVDWFVLGAVNASCDATGLIGENEYGKRLVYYRDTLNVVWRYLHTKSGLDGSCTAMQREIAIEAFEIFKPILQVEGGICGRCGEPNIAPMGYDCRTGL